MPLLSGSTTRDLQQAAARWRRANWSAFPDRDRLRPRRPRRRRRRRRAHLRRQGPTGRAPADRSCRRRRRRRRIRRRDRHRRAAPDRAFWPGPLTLIVPRRPGRGAAAAGGQDSIGLRMPGTSGGARAAAGGAATRRGRSRRPQRQPLRPRQPDDRGARAARVRRRAGGDRRRRLRRRHRIGDRRLHARAAGAAAAGPAVARPRSRPCWAGRWPRPTRLRPARRERSTSHYAPAAPRSAAGRRRAGRAAGRPRGRPIDDPPGSGLGVYSRVVPAAGADWSHRLDAGGCRSGGARVVLRCCAISTPQACRPSGSNGRRPDPNGTAFATACTAPPQPDPSCRRRTIGAGAARSPIPLPSPCTRFPEPR